jgi:hypothetical protein
VECYDPELHDASTDSSRDCEDSVSENSQVVADESVISKFSYVSISSLSITKLDDNTQTYTPTDTTFSTSVSYLPSPRSSNTGSESKLVLAVIDPIPMPDGSFMCPKCPRSFRTMTKAA